MRLEHKPSASLLETQVVAAFVGNERMIIAMLTHWHDNELCGTEPKRGHCYTDADISITDKAGTSVVFGERFDDIDYDNDAYNTIYAACYVLRSEFIDRCVALGISQEAITAALDR
jgi:hypothetical protein